MAPTSIASNGIVNELLKKGNYKDWSVLVRNYLRGQGLWNVVESGVSESDGNEQDAKALHIIQLSCGSDILAHIRDVETAKDAWNMLEAQFSDSGIGPSVDPGAGVPEDGPSGDTYTELSKHVESGNWSAVKSIIDRDETAIFSTSHSGRTALHVAVIAGHEKIVRELVKKGKEELVKMQDWWGYTALALAAELTGNVMIAVPMVRWGVQHLLTMGTESGEIPVLLAAAKGHKQMTRYLFQCTPMDVLDQYAGHRLSLFLTHCITAEIFDVALFVLQRFSKEEELPLTHISKNLGPLNTLANMPSAFPSDLIVPESFNTTIDIMSDVAQDEREDKACLSGRFSGLGWRITFSRSLLRFVQTSILLRFHGISEIYYLKCEHQMVLEILRCMSDRISNVEGSQLRDASAYDAVVDAARNGIVEFISSMGGANPDLLWVTDKMNRRNVISYAILNRRASVFKLIAGAGERKKEILSGVDGYGNTLLHLTGLGPHASLVHKSSAASQMLSEILWFKEVEKVVHPKIKETRNLDGLKPQQLFEENHMELMQAAEEWTKQAVNSFALVATVIISIMFAGAITVPGGNDQDTGMPILSHNKIFTVFSIADAISLFTASYSIVIFIQIVTTRDAGIDFLINFYKKFLYAFLALLVSVLSMIVAFSSALAIVLQKRRALPIVTTSLAGVLIILVTPSLLRLILEILYSSTILRKDSWH